MPDNIRSFIAISSTQTSKGYRDGVVALSNLLKHLQIVMKGNLHQTR